MNLYRKNRDTHQPATVNWQYNMTGVRRAAINKPRIR